MGNKKTRNNFYNFEGRYDLVRFIKTVQKVGLYVNLRIGPYVCAEWNFGGIPVWLKYVPGISFRTDNEPFKAAMQGFTQKIVQMMKSENLFQSQGGPIILSQIENEYGPESKAMGAAGHAYLNWAAYMAVGLGTGVPWVMCKEIDAPDPVINSCNGFYCDDFSPNKPYKPSMWTESWSGWFTEFGGPIHQRPVQDLAFAVARFIQKGGSYVNYYMYHGGTNFGRSAGGPFITTSYDYDAPIDEYALPYLAYMNDLGLIRQPKYSHLKDLHKVIKRCEHALVSSVPTVTSLGTYQQAHVFSAGTAGCAAFLANYHVQSAATVVFNNKHYDLPPWSISILPDCKTSVFNTAKVRISCRTYYGLSFSSIKSLTSQQLVRIHQLFRQAKFDDPSGHCLSPAGEYNLRLGIIKELHPDMVATYSGSAQVFEGHPFIVEAGISIGGKDVKQISPGVWFIGLFNGIGPTRTQSKMIIRGPAYSFAANITVEACTNSMMMGDFCNSPVYPFSCTTSNVNSTLKATTVNETMLENLMTCKSSLKTFCADESVSYIFSFDIINVADEFTIMASDVKFNVTPSNKTSGANDISLMCFVRHGSMPSVASFDYSSDLSKVPLVIHSPLIGLESHVLQCPLGKAGPNCTMDIYTLQTFVRRGPTPFESYYLPVSVGASYTSANFPLEPLLSYSSYNGEPGNIWTYLLLDIPRGAAGGNIHVQLSSDVKINYEVYIRFGGLPSLINRDYHYVNKSIKSDTSMFFMLYDSSDDKINFYIMYAREGTWGFGLRYLNTSHDPSKGPTVMSLSLERCPKRCSSHGDCKFSFDASGLTSYSFCSCDRNHGGIDCSIEIVSHQGHIRQSFFLIVSNAAAILPAYWALRQKALAEWVLFTSSGIASGLYHACDVGAWCALNFNVLQFMDFWLSFMAVISTFLYLATIDEVLKRAIHTAVAILTALMAVTNATRSSNVVLVMVIGALGLLIGWVIELSTKYRSLSFSVRFSLDFSQILQVIKQWICNLIGTLLRRYHWPFALAGFSALSLEILSRTLETSENYWFWHSFWHISIYTSSFFFLCSKANIRSNNCKVFDI
ncbi:unnamed protein product [Vicia faba]|uniref:Beta-galactosidase n=1 Tax=Vicia faba TaxID=3906 RepID=A0AAV1ALA2_VICFA|nr:unnamed protein product [Vicia faba]